MHLWVYGENGRKDYGASVVSLSLSDAMDQLGARLEFSIPWSDIASENAAPPSLGDSVTFSTSGDDAAGAHFAGLVTEAENSADRRKYICYDFCWYLNKTQITIQFADISVSDAIRELWAQCDIQAKLLADIPTTISETCYCETPSGILSKLLDEAENDTGKQYYAYAEIGNQNVVNVEEVGNRKSKAVLREITSPERSISLNGVTNHAVYVSGDSSGYYDTGTYAEDAESIERYGRITEIIIAEEEDANAQKIVSNKVYANAEPRPSASINCAGVWTLRPGWRVDAVDATTGIAGEWVVQEVSHTLEGGEHRTRLSLKAYKKAKTYEETVEEETKDNSDAIYVQSYTGNGRPPRTDEGLAEDEMYVKN